MTDKNKPSPWELNDLLVIGETVWGIEEEPGHIQMTITTRPTLDLMATKKEARDSIKWAIGAHCMEGERRKLYEETHRPVKLVLVSTTMKSERDALMDFVSEILEIWDDDTAPLSAFRGKFKEARTLLAEMEVK